MAEVTVTYGNSQIATMNASGTKTLETEAKYCTSDISVVYSRPSTGGGMSLDTSYGSVTRLRSFTGGNASLPYPELNTTSGGTT